MKKRVLGFMALLLLVGISTKYVGSTYAKYTGNVTKTSNATVALWAFNTDNQSSTGDLVISLPGTADPTTLVAERIAPGTKGSFTYTISNATSEVGIDYEVQFTTLTNIPSNLILKEGETTLDTSKKFVGHIVRGGEDTITIDWEWPYGDNSYQAGDTATGEDAEDVADGTKANRAVQIVATIRAKQTAPSTTAITTSHTANN